LPRQHHNVLGRVLVSVFPRLQINGAVMVSSRALQASRQRRHLAASRLLEAKRLISLKSPTIKGTPTGPSNGRLLTKISLGHCEEQSFLWCENSLYRDLMLVRKIDLPDHRFVEEGLLTVLIGDLCCFQCPCPIISKYSIM
jgi:hypothetical protein